MARYRFERRDRSSAADLPHLEKRRGGDVRPRHHVRQERRRPLLHREPRRAGRRRIPTVAAQHDVGQQHAAGEQSPQGPHPAGGHPLRTGLPRPHHRGDEEEPCAGDHLQRVREGTRQHLPRGTLLREAVPAAVVHGGLQRQRENHPYLFFGPRVCCPNDRQVVQIPR